jgi:hypothetical protein
VQQVLKNLASRITVCKYLISIMWQDICIPYEAMYISMLLDVCIPYVNVLRIQYVDFYIYLLYVSMHMCGPSAYNMLICTYAYLLQVCTFVVLFPSGAVHVLVQMTAP